jgi:hypothetical protein
MIASSPIPRGVQPKFHESSGLQSIRENDSTSRQWLRSRTMASNSGGSDRAMFYLNQKLNRLRRRVVGGGSTSSGSGMVWKGEYDPTAKYDVMDVVVFTPAGGAAGTYITNQAVSGVSPDVGLPNWTAFPNGSPGSWL